MRRKLAHNGIIDIFDTLMRMLLNFKRKETAEHAQISSV